MSGSFAASVLTTAFLLTLAAFRNLNPGVGLDSHEDLSSSSSSETYDGIAPGGNDEQATAFENCILAQGRNGRMVHSRSSNYYGVLIKQWNQRVNTTHPWAYFLPRTTADVQAGVKCGSRLGIRLYAKSGGHSFEPVSFGTNHSIVMDFREMTNITVQEHTPDGPVATLQPGAMLGHTVAYLWENGGYSFPMGNCFTVNIGGHAIGGGLGFWGTTYGLTLDQVVEFTMVTAKGEEVKANKDTNPELFWGLRGVGPGGLGFITEIKIKLFKAKNLKLTYITANYPVESFPEVFSAYQNFLDWGEANEPNVWSSMVISADHNSCPPNPDDPPAPGAPGIPCTSGKGIIVEGLHVYDPEKQTTDNSTFIKEFYKTFPAGNITMQLPDFLQFVYSTGSNPADKHKAGPWPQELYKNFLESTTEGNEEHTDEWVLDYLKNVNRDKAVPRFFKSKSFLVDKVLTTEQINKINNMLQTIPEDANWILFLPERGAIARVPFNETSYAHRHYMYSITVYCEAMYYKDLEEKGMEWLYKFWNLIEPIMDSGATYQNFPDEDYGKDVYPRRYWGDNLEGLINLKRKWDPKDYFKNTFSIPLNYP